MAQELGATLPPRYPERLTRAGKELMRRLEAAGRPIISARDFAVQVVELYRDRNGLMLRHLEPDAADVRRLRINLQRARIIALDRDYGLRAYRLIHLSDGPAEDICCLVDPTLYISHLSAMQRYGLTDRRPVAAHFSRPDPRSSKAPSPQLQGAPTGSAPKSVAHPKSVRGRDVRIHQTTHPGESLALRAGFARIASVGQVFVDSLEAPELCGGMPHVLDVWRAHATTYFAMIVPAMESASKIAKVRAGHILDEMLGLADARVMTWTQFAQRGGSRLLDPAKPYAPKFSERWMLSINAG